jgi:hypothetical protein
MKKVGAGGSFFLSFIINIILTAEWSIPAWILLALHFILHISIWWFVGALAVWILRILIGMTIIGLASKCSVPDPPKENKNPYSLSNGVIFGNK